MIRTGHYEREEITKENKEPEREQINSHKEKISAESQKSFPDEGCIAHWEKEIMAFERQIEKVKQKLEG